MSTETPVLPHSKCVTCQVDLDTPEDARRHRAETLEAAKVEGGHRGHSTQVVNPTPEEVAARRISSIVEDEIFKAMDRCFEEIDRRIDKGEITEEQATKEFGHGDFADAWDEWRTEGQR